MKPRYEGPKIVVRRNKNGSYILAEITGFVHQQKIAQFRVVPYYARNKIDIPGGVLSVIDLEESDLDIIEAQTQEDKSREIIVGRDYLGNDFTLEKAGEQVLRRADSSDDEEDDEADNIETENII